MSEITEFLINHWMLSGGFAVVLVLFLLNEIRQKAQGGSKLTSSQVVDLMNHKNAHVVDIRGREVFESGHIIGAQNIEEAEIADKVERLSKYKQKPLVVVCEQGTSCGKVAQNLSKQGFEQVYFLAGGISGWKADSLPLTKD